ncbi:unnamed protein product [Meloidogyne enterolobii]|uniref:Uncharacterized protein n=1 Tax=Meloidogyne enterolobii TaxID=390850 RepID=A0ACB0XKX0_MELEN
MIITDYLTLNFFQHSKLLFQVSSFQTHPFINFLFLQFSYGFYKCLLKRVLSLFSPLNFFKKGFIAFIRS